jgi:DNA-binding beta-propeller fold protein YncE
MAAVPYEGYVWNNLGQDVRSVNGYIYVDSIDGLDMPSGGFKNPESIFIGADDTIYVVDTENNRIVHMDKDHHFIKVFGTEGKGQLNGPKGVYVKEDGTVYVGDTKNHRIAIFDPNGQFLKEFGTPTSALLGKDFSYSPSKLIVDKRDYMFVVSDGNTQGLMQIDPRGEFKGFYGANHIGFSWVRLFTKLIASKEQKEQLSTVNPLEFSSVDQDEEGFIYSTTLGAEFNQIKRLSPVGVDTLNVGVQRRYGEKFSVGPFSVHSFVSISVSKSGIISALDLQTSKVFQYDKLGNLLFIFGGVGEQNGLFVTPSGIAQTSDGMLYVVDKGRGRIDRFRTTPFADLVHKASNYYVDGQYEESAKVWNEVLKFSANFDLAYQAIGKSLYKSERYGEAMEYFQLARNRFDYSAAFREYRKEYIREHFSWIFGGLILLILLIRLGIPRIAKKMKGVDPH